MKQDREAVRTLAIQIGVRPAARKLGLNEDTVCSWAKRENWFALPANPQPINTQALQAKPGDVLLSAIAEDDTPTRAALSKAHRKAAEAAQNLNGKALLNPRVALAVKAHGQGASLVHGWEAKQSSPNVMVNIALLGVDPQSVRVDSGDAAAHTIDVPDSSETD